ncbi:MAG: hypothetical protein LBB67_01115 [Oscillospiraceae bacterium]|nr:hypothetical protein [Oscillospiraceae bacterium]
MKMKTRALAVLLAVMLMTGFLVSCGEKEDDWIKVDYVVHYAPKVSNAKNPLSAMSDGDPKTYYEGKIATADEAAKARGNAIVFDLGQKLNSVAQIRYTPRQDGSLDGRITYYEIYASNPEFTYAGRQYTGNQKDLETMFTLVGSGRFDPASDETQTATFTPTSARYFVLLSLFGAAGDGVSAAEIGIYEGFAVSTNVWDHFAEIDAIAAIGTENQLTAAHQTADELRNVYGNNTVDYERLSIEEQTRRLDELKQLHKQFKNLGKAKTLPNGERWVDTSGALMESLGGNIFYDETAKLYYWYGADVSQENLDGTKRTPASGILCYSSSDFVNWKREGLALPVFNNPQFADGTKANAALPLYVSETSDVYRYSGLPQFSYKFGERIPLNGTMKAPAATLNTYFATVQSLGQLNAPYQNYSFEQKRSLYMAFNWDKLITRPQVLYNESTKQYVMWFGLAELVTGEPSESLAAVAVSGFPQGPFALLGVEKLPLQEKDGSVIENPQNDFSFFVDADKKAYLACADSTAGTISILPLDDTYTKLPEQPAAVIEAEDTVSPIFFKNEDIYYILAAKKSTAAMSDTVLFTAKNGIAGEWKSKGSVAKDDPKNSTFQSRGVAVLPLRGKDGGIVKNRYVFIADQLQPYAQNQSTHQWLPLKVSGQSASISWTNTAAPQKAGGLNLFWILLICLCAVLLAGAVLFAVKRKKSAADMDEPMRVCGQSAEAGTDSGEDDEDA